MEYNINGTIYLVKNKKLNFENDKYETKEYKLLKKWLVFSKSPKSLKEIQLLEEKIDIYLKKNINGYEYKNNKYLKQTIEKNKEILFKIPELYLRYLDILNNIIEI
jgi:hypothetical protein